MRVYHPASRNHTVYVSPAAGPLGTVHDGMSQWKNEDGEPVTQVVRFVGGAAEVDAQLGNWLIKNGYAKRTRLIIPDVARLIA